MKFKSNSYYKFYNFTDHVTIIITIIIIIKSSCELKKHPHILTINYLCPWFLFHCN